MSLQEKASSIKSLIEFIISVIPRIFDVVLEIITLIKEVKNA